MRAKATIAAAVNRPNCQLASASTANSMAPSNGDLPDEVLLSVRLTTCCACKQLLVSADRLSASDADLINNLQDRARSRSDINVIAARRTTRYGAEMDVFQR